MAFFFEIAQNCISTIPPEIGNLSNLTVLYLNMNKLREVCQELGSLKSLKELNLNSNYLRFLPKCNI